MIRRVLFIVIIGFISCNNTSKSDLVGKWIIIAKSNTVGISDMEFKNDILIFSDGQSFKDSIPYNLDENILILQGNSPNSMLLSFSKDTMILNGINKGKTILKLLKATPNNTEYLSSNKPKIIQKKKELNPVNIDVPKRKIKYSVTSSRFNDKEGYEIIFIDNDGVKSEKILKNSWTYEFQGDSGKCFFITHISLLNESGDYDVSDRSKKITIHKEMYIDDTLVSKVNIRNNELFVVIDKNYDCKKSISN